MKSFDVIKENQLLRTLQSLGIDTSMCNFTLRGYSKSYNGVYRPCTNNVYVYAIKRYKPNGEIEMYTYEELMLTAIHEMCHVMQYHDKNWVRVKGVMHDKQFWELYNTFASLFKRCLDEVISEGNYSNDKIEKIVGQGYVLSAKNSYGGFSSCDPIVNSVGRVPVSCVALRRRAKASDK